MKILIITHYFYPENFRINDLAIYLKDKDHKISVLTPIPNYPNGKYYSGYSIFNRRQEIWKGINIYRSLLIPRRSGSNIMLALSWTSSIIGNLFESIFLLKNKYDLIFVFGPSPFTICLPAIFIKKIKKIPICFWVLDLWPESVISAGNLKSRLIPNILSIIVKYIYRHSNKILVSSRGFIDSIVDKDINPQRIEFFPQWAELLFKPEEKNYDLLTNSIPDNSCKIMFAGNIGEAQDFPNILKAARILKENKNIHWLIVGDGRKAGWVKNKIVEYGLQNCFHMLGRHSIDKMPKFYSHATAMLISLKKEYIFSLTIPAKLQSYLACAKPVIAMIDGITADLVNESKAGLTCTSGNSDELAKNILIMSKMKENEINLMAKNSYDLYLNHFEREKLLYQLEKKLSSLVK